MDEMQRAKRAAEDFLSAQIELAHMYVAIAESADNSERRRRHATHARRVLSVVRLHLARHADAGACGEVRAAIERLESRLHAAEPGRIVE